jgi:hypothetical protein
MERSEGLQIVSAQIPVSDVARLQQQAREADRSLSAEIRRLIREHLLRPNAEKA